MPEITTVLWQLHVLLLWIQLGCPLICLIIRECFGENILFSEVLQYLCISQTICRSGNGQAYCLGKSLLLMGVVSLGLQVTQERKAERLGELKMQIVWHGWDMVGWGVQETRVDILVISTQGSVSFLSPFWAITQRLLPYFGSQAWAELCCRTEVVFAVHFTPLWDKQKPVGTSPPRIQCNQWDFFPSQRTCAVTAEPPPLPFQTHSLCTAGNSGTHPVWVLWSGAPGL